MTKPLRRLALVVLALFMALLVNVNVIQVVRAETYRERDEGRKIIEAYSVERGSILAADGTTEIARVEATNEDLRFRRLYDQGDLYAHTTGFLSPIYGRTALEQSEDEILSGSGNAIETFADLIANREPVGDDVVTTIVPSVQEAARDALGGRRGAVVALEPATGEVLAMWSFPSYDPNPLTSQTSATQTWEGLQADPANPLRNRATAEFYAPGSTFKLVTAAAALEAGMPPTREFPDPPATDLPGTEATIPNFGGSLCNGGAPLDLYHAIRVSCNTTFAQLGMEYGGEALIRQAQAFGFTTELGDQMPELVASPSPVPNIEPSQIDGATAAQTAIGQRDVRVTPLQMAVVAGAIGQGGVVYAPRLVQSYQDFAGSEIRRFEPAQVSQAISPATAAILRQAMVSVVAQGTGRQAQIPGVEVAGKTGTAQRGEGQNPNVWFVGFAPAASPRVAVAVVVEDGGNVGSEATGGAVAAPIARSVIQAALARP